ncbi:class I SAM-dependent methyltransferase [Larkinella insperata]|uniref:Class I SAM-dependent methyltransferase n=1 Tax=Larkinella insperata TaxID=332158 RepID=A0ABW3Q0P2_9BACT|nr:methyltransferase domain-containing protein [Larkinella insperata]
MTISRDDVVRKIHEMYPGDGYTLYHAQRYATLLDLLNRFANPQSSLLDIGVSRFTEIVRNHFDRPVDTLGFDKEGPTRYGNHYFFNLNDCQFPDRYRKDLPQYGAIVMAEVLEHLYTSPLLVYPFLKSILKPNGILIVQTPNAVAIHKRIKMILGKNPYELIRIQHDNPGHFREYTAEELFDYGEQVGLPPTHISFNNYFDYRYRPVGGEHPSTPMQKWEYLNKLFDMMPRGFRPGLTVVYQNRLAG